MKRLNQFLVIVGLLALAAWVAQPLLAQEEGLTEGETGFVEEAQPEEGDEGGAAPEPEPEVEIPPPRFIEPTPIAPPPMPQPRQQQRPMPAVVQAPTPPPTRMLEIIEFQNAPIMAVLDYYARLTNRSIIQAPNIAGVVNFRSQTNLTLEEGIQALDTVLAINGVAIVPMGEKFLKVVQIATAKQEGVAVGVGTGAPYAAADALMTQIIPLKFADAAEAVSTLQPYMHAYGQLMPLTKSNSIMITETAANLNQMLEIIKYIDQPTPLRMQTKIYIITHARAADVVQHLQTIIQETQQLGVRAAAPTAPTRPGIRPAAAQPPTVTAVPTPGEETLLEGKVIITSDERTNKIFILSRPANFTFFDELIAELDAKVDPDVIIRVIELEYANAEETAALLSSLITGAAPPPTGRRAPTPAAAGRAPTPAAAPIAAVTGAGGEATGFLQFAEGVRILPDSRTNSLLIMATREDMQRLIELIESMDTAVAQVLIEVVIAEVILRGEMDVGVEAFVRKFRGGQVDQTGGTRTGTPNAPIDVSSLITNVNPLALSSGLTYFMTFNNLKLDTVVRLLATSSRFKVLSTPVIQTLHNQEANIIVGESRPFPTSTVADVVATGTTAVRSSVEFRDIAIELKVTPRINPDGYVTMEIEQKINDVGDNVDIGGGVRIASITKREARSSVSVKDQSTIVLGGLIKEDKTTSETKVPFLGDIPMFGHLFKGKNTAKTRTELIVFIRPTVLRTETQASAEARRRSLKLKAGKELELEKEFGWPSPEEMERRAQPLTPDEYPDRFSAKVRALELQETDRPSAPEHPAPIN